MSRILSGIQPTGALHLGNYLGAMKQFPTLQTDNDCFFCIVDLHAITVRHDPEELKKNVRLVGAAYLALGIHAPMFVQSSIPQHAELAWILNCVARMGWMERMPQFKDKTGEDSERASVGLFSYPILQAADILLYKADAVPVGIDQLQHIELAGEIARKFNHDFKANDFFPRPRPLIQKQGGKIMSLQDGTRKMSKSDENDMSRINLTDDAALIGKKIKKATAAVEPLPYSPEEGYPNASVENLVNIYAAVSDTTPTDVLKSFGGMGYGVFKPALADLLISKLEPISTEMNRYLADPLHLDIALSSGNYRASVVAEATMKETKNILGLAKSR